MIGIQKLVLTLCKKHSCKSDSRKRKRVSQLKSSHSLTLDFRRLVASAQKACKIWNFELGLSWPATKQVGWPHLQVGWPAKHPSLQGLQLNMTLANQVFWFAWPPLQTTWSTNILAWLIHKTFWILSKTNTYELWANHPHLYFSLSLACL